MCSSSAVLCLGKPECAGRGGFHGSSARLAVAAAAAGGLGGRME